MNAGSRALGPGSLLAGRYQVERQIGSGGMGTVYAARQLAPVERAVAVKVIAAEHTADPTTVARFQREGRIMAEITAQGRHPNLVEVFEVDHSGGEWFLAMELLEGTTLADALAARGTLTLDEAAPILGGILEALTAAHARQVVHRDLKPANVFLVGAPRTIAAVKVLDFGVAKVVGLSAEQQLTRSGTVLGTPEFMAPEQAMGTQVDQRSDLYAVGCIAYAMLSGRPPFVDNWPLRVVMKQAFEPAPPLSRARPGLPRAEAVNAFVGRALEKKPADRYQTAAEMRAALDALVAGP